MFYLNVALLLIIIKYYMLKQKLFNKKIEKIFKENSIILVYHCNNISTKNWTSVKKKLSKIKSISTLLVQNRIANIILNSFIKNHEIRLTGNQKIMSFYHEKDNIQVQSSLFNHFSQIKELFQGPTFVLGCHTEEQICQIHNLLKKEVQFFFVGGFFQNQKITHLDLKKYINSGNGANLYYKNTNSLANYISIMNPPGSLSLCNILQQNTNIYLYNLNLLQNKLLYYLNLIIQK